MFFYRKPTWLTIGLILTITSILAFYLYLVNQSIKKSKEIQYIPKTESKTGVTIRKLSGEVSHGLHEIKIDDSTTILLYRGVESCTMIKK